MIGTTLGQYQILDKLGAGGMGEVYLARDTTLDRNVALKILTAGVSTDADRLARFEREAKALASLNHPHIAQIYGLESSTGTRAIVMEFVEGEDLAERLRRGALPIDDALNAARQVADALDVAHAAGVVHRDLKPANVKIRPDGVVKVLDFGLAKLASDQSPEGAGANSSTMTSPAMTGVGIILGTAAYMAPEQAKGLAVDKRADVWAFGCLLFEMLTAQRLFAADSVSETIAAVLTSEPQWTQLPAETPESIRRLLQRCLVRDLRKRLPDIGVARLEIDDAVSGAHAPAVPRRLTPLWPVAIATGVLGIAIGAAAAFNWLRAELREPPVRVLPVATHKLITSGQLSPDGRSLALVRGERLVVQSLETGQELEVPEDGVSNPFWHPDSTLIAYFRRQSELGTELRVVQADGVGSRVVISGAQGRKDRSSPYALSGGTWCRDGIVFVDTSPRRAMRMINATTGQEIRSFDNSGNLAYPHCLPDGRILAVRSTNDKASVVVVTEKEQVVLLEQDITNATDVRWPVLVGSDVVFERRDPTQGLWTFPVNAGLTPQTVAARLVRQDASRPSAAAGMLTALSVHRVDRNLVWVDRAGNNLGSFGKPQREFKSPSLSPEADKVITAGRRETTDALWLHTRDTVQKWHDEGRSGTDWSPDGNYIAFVKGGELVVRAAIGDERRVIASGTRPSWTPLSDGLVFRGPTNSVWFVRNAQGATPTRIIEDASEASVSLDGKLIAYVRNVTGRDEVFVATRAHPENGIRISTDGGRYPLWTKTEVFFACGQPVEDTPNQSRAMCVATVDPTSGERRDVKQLFDARALGFAVIAYSERGYDVTPDGRLLVQTDGREGTPSITLIENVKSWLKSVR